MKKLARKGNIELLSEILNDPDSKSVFKIFSDILSLMFYYKKFPRHYFARYLFKKGKSNIKDYFPNDFLYYKIKPFLNEQAVKDVVENKLYFNFFYIQFNISLPKILMYNHKKMFVKGNENFEINSVSDFKKQLEEIFLENPSYESIIVKRTYGSYGGDQVFKITVQQLATDNKLIDKLYFDVVQAGFLFQETVTQHPELNKLNPSCLNTIRFETFIDKDGKVEIISAYIRIGTNNQHVDNISSGGCQVGIWLQSGKLKKYGYSNFSYKGTLVYTTHPITKTVFEDFNIPYFSEAKELIVRIAGYMPGLRLVGWDMAIGESGPVLIEGNSNYDMDGSDLSEDGYLTNAIFRKMLHELNYL
jgi:hypothetical protein